jgi:hypothetical protein
MEPQGTIAMFPAEAFPILFEGRLAASKEVVWTERMEKPDTLTSIYVPPLSEQHGEPIEIRITFEGTAQDSGWVKKS